MVGRKLNKIYWKRYRKDKPTEKELKEFFKKSGKELKKFF